MQLSRFQRTNLLVVAALAAMLSLFVVSSMPYLVIALLVGTVAGFVGHFQVRQILAPDGLFVAFVVLVVGGFVLSAFVWEVLWVATASLLWTVSLAYILKPVKHKK